MMTKLNILVEIWGKTKTAELNDLAQKVYSDVKLSEVFAEVTSKSGSMLYGRPADTKLSKTTHKIVYRYDNYSNLTEENFIKINGKIYDIDYCDNRNMEKIFMDVFVSTPVRAGA